VKPPVRDEHLLTRGAILEAVARIGARHAQDFCRELATADEPGRQFAAEHLIDGEPAERRANLPILRNLILDGPEKVSMEAAVSLHLLGQEEAQAPILAWLSAPDGWTREAILECMRRRIKERRQIAFARKVLETIAQRQYFRGEDPAKAPLNLD
jgi:hypothetical protein